MKPDFDNTLTYIELIIPVLGELELVNWTSDDLFIILKENKLFEKYSNEDLLMQVQKTLKYLQKSGFVELENDEFQITPWAIDILNSIKDEKNQINEDDPSYNSKIRDIDIKYTKQINTQIKKAYEIPNQQFFYKDILDYLYHHPSSKTRIQIIKTMVDEKYNFTEDQLGVLIGIINGSKNSAIINRLYHAFEKLQNDGLIKKEKNLYKIIKSKKEHQSSKKPKIKQTQDIKTVKKPVKIEDNNNTTNEDIPNVATFNMYCEMIFKILSNNYSSDINTITQNILNIIMPDNYDKSVFELFKNQVHKILKQMLQKQLIIKNKDDNYEITENGFIQLNQDTTPKKPHFKTQTKPENPLTIFNKTYKQNNQSLPAKLLEKVKTCNPYFFEKLSLDLLNKMEFYKVKSFKGELTAKSNDGGVDGLIYLDPLSIKPVYFQSKRWKNNISRPEMQKFVGALNDKLADTGIYITTSSFDKVKNTAQTNITSLTKANVTYNKSQSGLCSYYGNYSGRNVLITTPNENTLIHILQTLKVEPLEVKTSNDTNETVKEDTTNSKSSSAQTTKSSKSSSKSSVKSSKSSSGGLWYDNEYGGWYDSNGRTAFEGQFPKGTSRKEVIRTLKEIGEG